VLDNITIVIITYKRYGFLKRLLLFFSKFQLKAKILILDSSPDNPVDDQLIDLLSQKSVSWKRYNDNIFFADKIAEGCENIKTEYAVLCADDDFLIPGALETCINFLDKNQDYASAHGLYFNHSSYENARYDIFQMNPLYENGRSAEQKNSTDRVTEYLYGKTVYYPMYAVHRTTVFQKIWTETMQYVSDQGLSELFPSCLSFAYGKMKVLPVFYNSREPNDYVSWYNEETYSIVYSEKKIEHAVIGISKYLSKFDDISLEEAKKVVREAFHNYVTRALTRVKIERESESKALISFLKRIKQKLRIRTRIIGWFNFLRYHGCYPSIYPEHFKDFKKVKESVLSSGLGLEELNLAREKIFYKNSTLS